MTSQCFPTYDLTPSAVSLLKWVGYFYPTRFQKPFAGHSQDSTHITISIVELAEKWRSYTPTNGRRYPSKTKNNPIGQTHLLNSARPIAKPNGSGSQTSSILAVGSLARISKTDNLNIRKSYPFALLPASVLFILVILDLKLASFVR